MRTDERDAAPVDLAVVVDPEVGVAGAAEEREASERRDGVEGCVESRAVPLDMVERTSRTSTSPGLGSGIGSSTSSAVSFFVNTMPLFVILPTLSCILLFFVA